MEVFHLVYRIRAFLDNHLEHIAFERETSIAVQTKLVEKKKSLASRAVSPIFALIEVL